MDGAGAAKAITQQTARTPAIALIAADNLAMARLLFRTF